MREPHPRAPAFSGDVSNTEDRVETGVRGSQEIAGKVAYRENLTRNIEQTAAKTARRAQPSLDLCSFGEFTSQPVMVTPQGGELFAESAAARGRAAG